MSIATTFKENFINDGFEEDNITGPESVTNIEGNVYIKYALHCAGYAKDYKVEGTMYLSLSWIEEEIVGNGATYIINN